MELVTHVAKEHQEQEEGRTITPKSAKKGLNQALYSMSQCEMSWQDESLQALNRQSKTF